MNIERERLKIYSEILDIFKGLYRVTDTSEREESAFRIRALYVEYLKRIVKIDSGSLESLNGYGNCYSFALGIKCPDIFIKRTLKFNDYGIPLNPGFISTQFHLAMPQSKFDLIRNFNRDCEELEIEVYDSDVAKTPVHGGYKIFLFADKAIDKNCDFHFVRQNSDGRLVHRVHANGDIEPLRDLREVNPKYELVRTMEVVKPVLRERTM